MDDLISKLQTARTLIGFATIGGPAAAVIIIVFIFVFLIVMSTPGLSGQQENVSVQSPSSSFAPAPKTNINFYCQYDSKWTSSQCNITENGCDPTSIAIILSSFGDKEWTPEDVALRNGGIGCKGVTTSNQTIDALRWVKTLGYKVAGLDPNEDNSGYLIIDDGEFNFLRAKKFLDAGYLIHIGAVMTFKSNGIKRGGHSVVVTDVNPSSEEIIVYDPTNCFTDNDNGERTLTKDDFGGDGTNSVWFWAFPVKKG